MLQIIHFQNKGRLFPILLGLLCLFLLPGFLKEKSYAADIQTAEYFFDMDPGEGNGFPLLSADGSFDSSEEDVNLSGIDTSSLKIGSHTLYVRFKNADGVWGLARPVTHDPDFNSPYNFTITGDKWIAGAECFVGTDPGQGNGLPVSAKDGVFDEPEEDLVLSDIDVSAYGPDSHTLYLRCVDNEGTWGMLRQVQFEIHDRSTFAIISGAEYFIDTDPGSGNGTPIPAADGNFDSSEEQVDVSGITTTGLTEGVHMLYARFMDKLGRWGAFSSQPFSINRPVAFAHPAPFQPLTGDGLIPLSVVVSDHFGSDTCKLKVEYSTDSGSTWDRITIQQGSVSATHGTPALNNGLEYQIGNSSGWITTSSGPNTVSFVWQSEQDLGKTETQGITLRFTIHNGTEAYITSTMSGVFPIDNEAPSIPVLNPYTPDPTGDTTPTLTWRKASGADHYRVKIASDAGFSTIILNQSNIGSAEFTPSTPFPLGEIFWRVVSVDSLNNESPYSVTDHFTIVADSARPSVTLSYSESSPAAAGPLTITAVFNEPIITIPKISINQPGSMDINAASMIGSGTTWTYSYLIHCADGNSFMDGMAAVTVTNGFDSAGNENLSAQNNTFAIDTSACGSGNIIASEYFFDMDPGEGSGLPLPSADGSFDSSEEDVNLSGIDTSSLKIGSHTLYVRFKNADGVWGLARPVTHDPDFNSPYNFTITGNQWIAGAECFIDVDPGQGSGILVSAEDGVFDEPEEDLVLSDIDVSAYGPGFHTLYLRCVDNEGTWGMLRQVRFEIFERSTFATISGAEYFIDTDPGPGNGTPIPAADGNFDSSEEQVNVSGISTTGLTEGVHTLSVRFIDQFGRWGVALSASFTITGESIDSDGDGMMDAWETENGLDPHNPLDAAGDLDDDGLSNLNEYLSNTDPRNPDTDNDKMPDGWEITYGLIPNDSSDATGDLDSDRLNNLNEFLKNTVPINPDTDDDGFYDGDEVNYGTDPNALETITIQTKSKDILVSLTGNNRIIIEVINGFWTYKEIQLTLTGIDSGWYTIAAEDQNFILLPFERKEIAIQLHLPGSCAIPATEYPFQIKASWIHNGQTYIESDDGNLVVTPNPNVYRLAIPEQPRLAGNKILVAWKTDIPVDGYVYYRKLGDESFIQVEAGINALEHRVTLTDLEYFTYYEYYTENQSTCGGLTATEPTLIRTGKAVKFANNVNEFWVDRDYYQPVVMTISNTDLIEHTYQLSVINDNEDIVVDFVGEGSNGREATLQPGASTDIELVIHAPDAVKERYDIYLKIVSDEGEADSFVDYSHAIVHVRSFVANLDIQPVESTPGLMAYNFRLINYGDTLSDIKVYLDKDNLTKAWMETEINHLRLENGQSIPFTVRAQEYTTGTVYARSGNYIVSATFEIGCPPETSLNTYTLHDLSVVAHIKDWYCTNKQTLELPFAVPSGITHAGLSEAAVEMNFSLPMPPEKYDPHTVIISVNGNQVAALENTIPQGQYIFRIPTSFINLGYDAPPSNYLKIETQDIGVGQYIILTDFKIILNINEMNIKLCVPPPPDLFEEWKDIPEPQTKIMTIGPIKKYRPGDLVDHLTVTLMNNDNKVHSGILTLSVDNNSYNGEIQPEVLVETIDVPPGKQMIFPDDFNVNQEKYILTIPEDADDIEYTLSASFENNTLNTVHSLNNRPGFYVRTPLVIVHGVMGSELHNADGALWNVKSLLTPCDNNLDELTFDSSGTPNQEGIIATKVIRDYAKLQLFGYNIAIAGDVFNRLEDHLRHHKYKVYTAGSGIEETPDFDLNNIHLDPKEKEDIFYFVYDWRFDNSTTADKLKIFIDNIIKAEGYSKVNIIAHSMGGLVCKSALQKDALMHEKINNIIFVGTPNLGAVENFTLMKHGLRAPRFGQTIYVDYVELLTRASSGLSTIINAEKMLMDPNKKAALSTIIGVVDADLKTKDPYFCSNRYEFAKSLLSAIKLFSDLEIRSALLNILDYYNKDKDLNWIRDIQAKRLSETLPSSFELLPSEKYFTHINSGYYEYNNEEAATYYQMDSYLHTWFNDTLLDNAKTFHNQIDNLPIPNSSYAIIGCKKCTTGKVLEFDNPWLSLNFIPGDGDGTVQLDSALDIDVSRKYVALYAEHMNLPSQPGVKKLIRSLLKGYEDNFDRSLLYPVEEYSEGICGVPSCISGAKIMIPFPYFVLPDFTLTDIDNRITWISPNGIRLGILGSDYQFINEGIEIYVPDGSAYTLEFHGVDREYLDIKFQIMSEGGVIKTYIFSNITLDMGDCGQVTFDLTNMITDPVLRLDRDCDGSYEAENITPTDILDENESNDFIAPVTTALVSGTLGSNGWYTSGVSVTLNAIDEGGSGLLATRYRMSDDAAYTEYSGTIQLNEPGDYTIFYFSIDRNLNKETEKVLNIKIENTVPKILSVTDSGIYSLGTTSFSTSWEIETGTSGIQDVQYSLGTAPGQSDIIGWTSAGAVNAINLDSLSLNESCNNSIYINVKAINNAGQESEVVSSDGVIILAAGGDPDADSFVNETELVAGSNPCNEFSIPKDTTIDLKKGFNLIAIPAEIMFQPDLKDWLSHIGTSPEIEKVMIYDSSNGRYTTLIPDATSNPSFILDGGEGLLVYAKQNKEINCTSALCVNYDLISGLNVVGIACPPNGYTAYQLLTDVGQQNIASIQRYSAEKGAFETAGFEADGTIAGVDFQIVPGEGYFINMKTEVNAFRP